MLCDAEHYLKQNFTRTRGRVKIKVRYKNSCNQHSEVKRKKQARAFPELVKYIENAVEDGILQVHFKALILLKLKYVQSNGNIFATANDTDVVVVLRGKFHHLLKFC